MNKKIIHSVFEHIAGAYPDHVAVKEAQGQITYTDLNRQANRLCHILGQLGFHKQDTVGVMMPSSIQLVGALLATFKAGGIYLPINSDSPKRKLKQVLDQCKPQVFMVQEADYERVLDLLAALGVDWKYIMALDTQGGVRAFSPASGEVEEVVLSESPSGNPPVVSDPDDGNYIFYTSGSTGEPKAILGCHKSLGHFIDWEIKAFDIDSTCRVSQLAALTFDASLRDIFLPLCTGGTLHIPSAEEKSNALKLMKWLEDNEITVVHTVPSILRLMNKMLHDEGGKEGNRFQQLQYLMLSGETLYAKDVMAWRKYVGHHTKLVNLYGATETTMIRTYHVIGDVQGDYQQRLPVGQAISHTVVAVISDGMACKAGEIGEVYMKSPFFTKGYCFDPILHQKAFVQNPLTDEGSDIVYKTGDLGRLLEDGSLEVLGRVDSQVKVNGVRVELNEVEQAMLSIEGVRESVILLHTDKNLESALVCYYTGVGMDAEHIQGLLAERLESAAIPHWIKHLEEMPLNMNGKVDRKSLSNAELFLNEQEYKAPIGEVEEQLEAIWKEVLNLEQVSRDTSFFSIGGTSLKAIQAISRIFKQFDTFLKIGDLFDNPTIMELAEVVDKAKKKEYYNITPVSPQEYYDVTYAQKRLWIIDQLEEGQVAYNMPCAYQIRGELEVAVFQEALLRVIARHEILRTTFINIDGQPMQKIHAEGAFGHAVRVIDLRNEEGQQERIHQVAEEDWNLPFDLVSGPLFRTILLILDDDRFALLFNMHHIISDGWTLDLLSYEVFRVYEGLLEKNTSVLPPLRIQYKDFAHWEKQQLSGTQLQKHRAFWLDHLEGELPVLEIQNTGSRSDTMTYKGNLVEFEIDQSMTSGLMEMSKKNETTIFMVLLALTKVLLYRFSGQNDIVVGIPTANRGHEDLENQAGFYVNTLAVRTRFDAKTAFTALLAQIKSTMVGVYEHAIYPIDLLVEDLRLDYDAARNSLFDVMVQIQDTKASLRHAAALDKFDIEKMDIRPTSSKFDFTFNYFIEDDRLLVGIEFNTDLYDVQLIHDMKESLQVLVEKLLTDSSSPISELRNQILKSEDKKQLEEQYKLTRSEISNDY